MAGQRSTTLVSIVLIGIVLAAVYIAFTFTPRYASSESFVDTAPTRASSCNCLPGYIPSNGSSGIGGNLYSGTGGVVYYVPTGTHMAYKVDKQNACGLPVNGIHPDILTWWNPPTTSHTGEVLTCDKVQPAAASTSTYVCQKLGDPTVTRKCY